MKRQDWPWDAAGSTPKGHLPLASGGLKNRPTQVRVWVRVRMNQEKKKSEEKKSAQTKASQSTHQKVHTNGMFPLVSAQQLGSFWRVPII